MKRISEISNVEILKADEYFNDSKYKGKFVAYGNVGPNDPRFKEYSPIRTSILVKIDIEAGTIETLNTVYKIV